MIIHENFPKSDISAYQQSKFGNNCCGDSYFFHETDEYFICAVADGLGSGSQAQVSSVSAIEAVKSFHQEDVRTIMDECNASLVKKRGAVVAVFKLYYDKMEIEYSCVGNIKFLLYSPSCNLTHPLPTSGFLSGRPQQVKVQTFQVEPESTFIIFSDGLQIRSIKKMVCNIETPEQATKEIEKIVDQPNDDVTFLVGKIN